jgi:hypothetical protein
MLSFSFFLLYVLCGVVYSFPLYRTQQAGTSVNSCTVYTYSKDQEFETRPRQQPSYLGISGVSSVRPDNHWASEGFNQQLMPLCYTACNDRCTCATRHTEQPTLVYCQQHSARQGHMTLTTAYSPPVTNFLLIYRRSFLRCRDVPKPLSD